MTDKRAIFFNYFGDQICHFAEDLQKKGFEIIVANDDDSHDCLKRHNVNHVFRTDTESSALLSKLYHDLAARKVVDAVLIIECESSLSTEGFNANLQLR